MARPGWSFPYAALPSGAEDDGWGDDVVVATERATDAAEVARALGARWPEAEARPVAAPAPLYWTRVQLGARMPRAEIAQALRERGVRVRFVASCDRGSVEVAPPLPAAPAPKARPRGWRRHVPAPRQREHKASEGRGAEHWFLGEAEGGVGVDRELCGHGAGRRLAVIDDNALEIEQLDLDAEVLVGVDRPPRALVHGSLMVAWATRTAGHRYQGVAPGASARLYCIPRPEGDALSLPLALAQAVEDGADVVLCTTHVEGRHGPLLDDALEFARRRGRGGLGALVVLATGREARGAPDSIHASFSLSLADPASDPRVVCVGPSSRGVGGWFLWRDRRGKLRPFGNRGPATRWIAPGDDLPYPFTADRRLFHAESSGSAAIAAGVALLVLSQNPALTAPEVSTLLTRTATAVAPAASPHARPLADPWDVLPHEQDADGHNAKHGYGLLHAARACAAAADPLSLLLLSMGEQGAALAYAAQRRKAPAGRRGYAARLGRAVVRALLRDDELRHRGAVLLRHARLMTERTAAQPDGALLRQLVLLLREVREAGRGPAVQLAALERRLLAALGGEAAARAALERRLLSALDPRAWTTVAQAPRQERAPA